MLAVAVRPNWATAALAAAVAGAISAYLDLMTTMPGALALTSVGATLGACVAGRVSLRTWRIAAAAVVGWIVGLAWMWGWKWVIAAAVLGFDTVDDERPLADRVPTLEREQRRDRLALRWPHRQPRDVVGPPAHAVGGGRHPSLPSVCWHS